MRMSKKIKRGKLRSFGVNPDGFHKSQLKFYAYLIPLGLVMVLPIVYIFVTAFKPVDELFAYPPRFYVVNPTFGNFERLFEITAGTSVPASPVFVQYFFDHAGSYCIQHLDIGQRRVCFIQKRIPRQKRTAAD